MELSMKERLVAAMIRDGQIVTNRFGRRLTTSAVIDSVSDSLGYPEVDRHLIALIQAINGGTDTDVSGAAHQWFNAVVTHNADLMVEQEKDGVRYEFSGEKEHEHA